MGEYNQLTIHLRKKGILYDPIDYLNFHVIVTLDTSAFNGTNIKTIIDDHFNDIKKKIHPIINNLENLKELKSNVTTAIDGIKLNIKEYKELKEQFEKDYPDYVGFFEEINEHLELFVQSFEEAFSSAGAQYSQYRYGS